MEFAYNNSYHVNLGMAPCEVLDWGWRESSLIGPDLIWEMTEQIGKDRARMLIAQSRQKDYEDRKQTPIEVEEGD